MIRPAAKETKDRISMKSGISKIFTLILLIIFFVGMLVMLYPAISQYWNSKVQSRAVFDYQKMMEAISEEDFTEQFAQADEYNGKLRELPFPMKDYPKLKDYKQCLNHFGNGMMGYITIDKIGVNLPIYHGTGSSVLNSACGHLEGTSLPVGGESTHCVLSAHRGLPSAKLFTDLDKMQIGDIFTVTILGKVLTYQVDQIKVVSPNQVDDLQIEDGRDLVTLLTCTPYGINTHRLLVRGTRIETTENRVIYVNSEAYLIDRLIVTPIVALPILFVLIVYVIFNPVKPKKKYDPLEEYI